MVNETTKCFVLCGEAALCLPSTPAAVDPGIQVQEAARIQGARLPVEAISFCGGDLARGGRRPVTRAMTAPTTEDH
jgi:hypothetical protein